MDREIEGVERRDMAIKFRETFARGTKEREALEGSVLNVLMHADTKWSNRELAQKVVERIVGDVESH